MKARSRSRSRRSRAGKKEYLPASPAEPGGRCRTTTRASFSRVAEEEATTRPRRSDELGCDIRGAGKGRRGRGRKDSSFSGQITAPSRKPFAAFFPSSSSPSKSPREGQAQPFFSLSVFSLHRAARPRLGSRRLPPPARRPSKRRRNLFPSIIGRSSTSHLLGKVGKRWLRCLSSGNAQRRAKAHLAPEAESPSRRRRWTGSIDPRRRGVRSRGREDRRGRLAPRRAARAPADPPAAGEGRQEHARSPPPLVPWLPPLGAAAAALAILLGGLEAWNSCSRLAEREKRARPSAYCSGMLSLARSSHCLLPSFLTLAPPAAQLPSLFSGF